MRRHQLAVLRFACAVVILLAQMPAHPRASQGASGLHWVHALVKAAGKDSITLQLKDSELTVLVSKKTELIRTPFADQPPRSADALVDVGSLVEVHYADGARGALNVLLIIDGLADHSAGLSKKPQRSAIGTADTLRGTTLLFQIDRLRAVALPASVILLDEDGRLIAVGPGAVRARLVKGERISVIYGATSYGEASSSLSFGSGPTARIIRKLRAIQQAGTSP